MPKGGSPTPDWIRLSSKLKRENKFIKMIVSNFYEMKKKPYRSLRAMGL